MSRQLSLRPMSEAEARAATEQVKTDAAALWRSLLRLYEGQAHTALGYSSWSDYCAAEFDIGKSRAYQLLDAGRVVAALEAPQSTAVDSDDGDEDLVAEYGFVVAGGPQSTAVDSDEVDVPLPPPSSEAVARRLAVTAKTDPKRAQKVWKQAVRQHGPDATAEQVAQIANGQPAAEGWEQDMRALANDLRRVANSKDPRDAKRALARWRPMYGVLGRIAKEQPAPREGGRPASAVVEGGVGQFERRYAELRRIHDRTHQIAEELGCSIAEANRRAREEQGQ